MAEPILIRPTPGTEHCTWLLGREFDVSAKGEGDLAAAAQAAAGGPATLLLPGTEVLLTRVRLPVRSRRRARTAVPWALEDRLVTDVEALHFALGAVEGDEWPVAVVTRSVLAGWLARCDAAGLDVHSVVPEPLALPRPAPGEWTVLEEAESVAVRTDAALGFSCESDLLAVVAGAETPPEAIRLWRTSAAPGAQWPAPFHDVPTEVEALADPPIGAFIEADRAPINLLQGSFSRREKRLEMLRQWRLPAALAAALLVVLGLQGMLAYIEMGQRQAELEARIQALYQEAFPEARPTADPRAQVQSRLRALRAQDGGDSRFSETVLSAGTVIEEQGDARLEALEWVRGRLELDVAAGELADLDALQRGLEEQGLPAELSNVDRDGDRVAARLTVTEASP